jgi:hypothetical protein
MVILISAERNVIKFDTTSWQKIKTKTKQITCRENVINVIKSIYIMLNEEN